jgi:hypothetical protein
VSNIARIIDVRDGCVSAIVTAWNASASPMGSNDACSAEYEFPLAENDLAGMSGRKVYVYPRRRDRREHASRSQYFNDYEIGIAIAERYTAAAGLVPTAWVDARVNFVEQMVIDTIDYDEETSYATGYLLGALWCTEIEVVDVYRPEDLARLKLFFSEVVMTFREASSP